VNADKPLLVSFAEASFQLSLEVADVEQLVKEGELVAVVVRGQRLVVFASITALISRKRRAALRREVREDCVEA
jgi:hypothetical protein